MKQNQDVDEGGEGHKQDASAPRKGAYHVTVDRDLCKGHGTCVSEAPCHFALDSEGRLEILNAMPEASDMERIHAAVRHCPTQALRVEQEAD